MYGRLKKYVLHSDSEGENDDEKVLVTKKENKNKREDAEENYDYDKEGYFKSITDIKDRKDKKNEEKNQLEKEKAERIFNEKQVPVEVQYCGICNKRINDSSEFESHLSSKLHLKKLKNKTIDELNHYSSVRNYLVDKGLIGKSKRSNMNRTKEIFYKLSLKKLINN